MKRVQYIGIIVLGVTLAAGFVFFKHRQAASPANITKQPSQTDTTTGAQPETAQPAAFNKQLYSLTDPASQWVIVNKQRPLSPKDYTPGDLVAPAIPLRSNITNTEKYVRQMTATALEKMVAAAKADGITLNLQSGYRSYNFQVSLYNRYVDQQGQAVADTQSARPGYSEHQTGLSADLGGTTNPGCNVETCFGETPEGQWIAAHAYTYGFIVRYPLNRTATTGYIYEPWHVRYVGTDLATEMHKTNTTTLEDFFGTGNAPGY